MGCIFLRPFGVPMVERIRLLLYWPHTTALVAYNGGTSVGQGPVRTLFLEPDFVSRAGTLDVGHGPGRTLFLSLILFPVLAHWMLDMAVSGLFSWA